MEAIGADLYNQNVTGGVSMTLTAIKTDPHHVPCVIVIDHHPHDSRIKLMDGEVCQTLPTRMGTGGGNVPLIMELKDGTNYSDRKTIL